MVNLAIFGKIETCGQTVLPDRSIFIEQIVENAQNVKIQMRHFE